MECLLFLWWNFALYLACYLHDTLHCNIYMDGTMCMDGTSLCMNNVYGWNWCDMWYETYVLDMCWIWNDGWNLFMYEMMDGPCLCMKWCMNLFMWWMPVKYIYMSYIFSVQIVGFNKKQKKQTICRLFAVCHRRQRALCRLPRTAKKPRGSQLCFLGADPFGQFAYSGRRQRLCRPWQTAKNLHFAISGRRQRTCHLVTCRWHHKADGKEPAI